MNRKRTQLGLGQVSVAQRPQMPQPPTAGPEHGDSAGGFAPSSSPNTPLSRDEPRGAADGAGPRAPRVASPKDGDGIAYRPTLPAARVQTGEVPVPQVAVFGQPVPASERSAPGTHAPPVDARAEENGPSAVPPSAPASGANAKTASSRRPRVNREALRVDQVGQAAVDAAVRAGKSAIFKLLRARNELATAPINHRDGFLLAHVDGATSVQGLIDISGMPEAEVFDILERLKRLGIVGLASA